MKTTILVIDDHVDSRENISEILGLADYNVLQAREGKEGLELARKHHPDLILCDIVMPGLDGYGVLHALQNNPNLSSIPFVFLTGETDRNSYRTAMDLGADDYLAKPFSGDDLLKVVSTRLNKNQVLKKSFSGYVDRFNDFITEIKSLNKNNIFSEKIINKKFRKKEFIFHEGDKAESLYFILSGKVKTFKTNFWGKQYITDIYKEDDFLGFIALLEESEHQEFAMAMEPSQLALISKQDFYSILHSNNNVSDSFTKILAHNLAMSGEKLINLAYDSARKKVAEALIFISQKYRLTGDIALTFPIDRSNISAIAGLSPESVSRNLTDLRQEGLIQIKNGTISILDIQKLENLKC